MGTMTNGFTRLTEQFLVHIGVERGLATATVTAYESDIAKYIDWLETRGIHEPDAITKQDVEDYIAALDQAGESARSKARRLASIHEFHRFALGQHAVTADVSAAVKAPKGASTLPDVLTVDEVTRLLDAAAVGGSTDPVVLRDKALLFLGAGAIIFACHHEQDIWKMGGIMKRMKLTSLTFIIATMALVAIPFTSGFFSKEAILEAALHKNPVFFWIGAGVALLTTFYMMRVIFVVFFGKSRSHSSEHATEVGGLMLVPLLILAVLALISGYGFMADRLVPFNGFVSESFHIGMPFYVSMGALVLGILLAAVFYAGSPASDKLSGNAVSRALANRLYIDWFYDKVLVRGIQGSLAAIIDFMDQFIISGLIVGGLARLTAAVGSLLRRLQSGSMAAYTALFGIGLLLVIYFTVFYSC